MQPCRRRKRRCKRNYYTHPCEHPRLARIRYRVDFRLGDLTDADFVHSLIDQDTTAVFHFASLVSGGAEADFPAGMAANVAAPELLLEACRLCLMSK